MKTPPDKSVIESAENAPDLLRSGGFDGSL